MEAEPVMAMMIDEALAGEVMTLTSTRALALRACLTWVPSLSRACTNTRVSE